MDTRHRDYTNLDPSSGVMVAVEAPVVEKTVAQWIGDTWVVSVVAQGLDDSEELVDCGYPHHWQSQLESVRPSRWNPAGSMFL